MVVHDNETFYRTKRRDRCGPEKSLVSVTNPSDCQDGRNPIRTCTHIYTRSLHTRLLAASCKYKLEYSERGRWPYLTVPGHLHIPVDRRSDEVSFVTTQLRITLHTQGRMDACRLKRICRCRLPAARVGFYWKTDDRSRSENNVGQSSLYQAQKYISEDRIFSVPRGSRFVRI